MEFGKFHYAKIPLRYLARALARELVRELVC